MGGHCFVHDHFPLTALRSRTAPTTADRRGPPRGVSRSRSPPGGPRRKRSLSVACGVRIDRPLDPSYAGPINLQVPPELEAKLTRLATETGRSVDQVVLDLLASSIDHDEWFRSEVEKGRAAAREGRLLEHDDVAARMDRRYRG